MVAIRERDAHRVPRRRPCRNVAPSANRPGCIARRSRNSSLTKIIEGVADTRLRTTFEALEAASVPSYRAWRGAECISVEDMRSVLLRLRRAASTWPPPDGRRHVDLAASHSARRRAIAYVSTLPGSASTARLSGAFHTSADKSRARSHALNGRYPLMSRDTRGNGVQVVGGSNPPCPPNRFTSAPTSSCRTSSEGVACNVARAQ
jgi:hypothetical protein